MDLEHIDDDLVMTFERKQTIENKDNKDIKDLIKEALSSNGNFKCLVLDLYNIKFINLGFVSVVYDLYETLEKKNINLTIKCPQENVKGLLREQLPDEVTKNIKIEGNYVDDVINNIISKRRYSHKNISVKRVYK